MNTSWTQPEVIVERCAKPPKIACLHHWAAYVIYKGSPIGLAKNISDSIKVGRWKHSDLKQQQRDVDTFLANAGMSAQGAEAVARLIRNGAFDGEMYTQLSPQDAAILDGLENDLHIEAGHCINFLRSVSHATRRSPH